MAELVSASTLNCIYFGLFLLGVGYAVFIVITGGLSNVDIPDVNIDVPGADIQIGGPDLPSAGLDSPDVAVSPLSPITIATFITTFGGVGVLATQLFGVDARWSLLWATGAGLVLSGIAFLFYTQFLLRSQASSEVRASELIGLDAEVDVPIGTATTGQVSYETKAGRMRSMARSVDNIAIPRGQLVEIVRVVGPMVLVKPCSEPDDQARSE